MKEQIKEQEESYKKSVSEKNDLLIQLLEEQNQIKDLHVNYKAELLESTTKIEGQENQLEGRDKYIQSENERNQIKFKELDNLKNTTKEKDELITDLKTQIENLEINITQLGIYYSLLEKKKDNILKKSKTVKIEEKIVEEVIDKEKITPQKQKFNTHQEEKALSRKETQNEEFIKNNLNELENGILFEEFKETPCNQTFEIFMAEFPHEKLDYNAHIEIKYKNQVYNTKKQTGFTPQYEGEMITLHKFQPNDCKNQSIKAFNGSELVCKFPFTVIYFFLKVRQRILVRIMMQYYSGLKEKIFFQMKIPQSSSYAFKLIYMKKLLSQIILTTPQKRQLKN